MTWLQDAERVMLGTYRQAPVVFTRGEGCRLEDTDGRRYLDLSAGIAVASVGHGHPRLARAIGDQAARLMHVSNLFYNDRAVELARALVERTPFDRIFFCNSGTEANETMLKLARRYWYEQGDTGRTELVAATGSFHGRTMGALSLTGQPKHHTGMDPLLSGVRHVPYGDAEALRDAVGTQTAAVVLEPVQGEGGVVVPPDEYLRRARDICDHAGALLLLDEVQTCYGRTGRFLALEHTGIEPDACALAKGMGGGFPLGAMLCRERVAGGLPPGSHASTFGGNALACAAGLAVLAIFDEEELVRHASAQGESLGRSLAERVSRHAAAVDVRGRGLLRGLQLAPDVDPVAVLARIRERGVLLSVAGGDVLRFSPPLVVSAAEIDEGLEAVDAVLQDPPRKEPS